MKRSLLQSLVILLTISVIATFAVAGCKKGEVTTKEEVTEEEVTEEEVTEEVTLKILHWAGPEDDWLVAQLDDFTNKTGIKVEWDVTTYDEIYVRLNRELIEGIGTYDVVFAGEYPVVINKGQYIPIEDYLTPEEVSVFYAAANYTDPRTGKVAAIGFFHNWPMFYYRADLINDPNEQADFKEKYGRDLTIPANYDELIEVAEFFNRPPDMYGYMISGVDWALQQDFTYALFAEGGDYGDKDGNLTLNSPEAIKAMEDIVKLTEFCPPGWETFTFFDSDSLMLAGNLFMYQNWFYIWNSLQTEMGDKIAVAKPIGGGAMLSGDIALIPKGASNPDAAAEFLKWLGSYDVQKQMMLDTGNFSSRSDVLDDPEVVKSFEGIEKFKAAGNAAKALPLTWNSEAVEGIHAAFFMVINGEMTVKEAMDWLQNEKFAGRKVIE